MKLKFWGTRGSIPVPGKDTLKYGGNTPCVEIRSNDNKLIILDGGSGIRELGNYLMDNQYKEEIRILISHYHWDHIQGIPFFKPLYSSDAKLRFYGLTINNMNIKDYLHLQMKSNYFPIKMDDVDAKVRYEHMEVNKNYVFDDLIIETYQVNHSSPTLTYRISNNGKKLVYMTDNELYSIENGYHDIMKDEGFISDNQELIDFCSGCDYLIHDTMYDEETIRDKAGWGHSSNVALAYFSILAKVKNLVLFHYNPEYTDKKIDELYKETQQVLNEQKSGVMCIAAKEGLEINF
ncbi:MAG TPA: MBL fold metallo-hydrolase [Ignavibacteriaceae bacterium]|nr:MBL fold metallo-hydrolase [Ignavibacteriaceae bacterium]